MPSRTVPEPAPVDAVVVTYQSEADIGACLGALASLPHPGKVVVVDHGSDRSAAIARSLGAIVVADPTNPGFGTGQNRGVRHTDSPYVLLVNPDAVVEATGIAAGVAVLDASPDVAAVQGIVTDRRSGRPERSAGAPLGPVHLLGRALHARHLLRSPLVRRAVMGAPGLAVLADHVERVPSGATDVEALGATALLVRRAAFDAVGGFDQGYFLYGEDLDLCRRLRRDRWRLITLPIPWATHAAGSSSPGWWDHEVVWWEGALHYAARWWSPGRWALARTAAAIQIVPMIALQPKRTGELIERMVVGPRRVRAATTRTARGR